MKYIFVFILFCFSTYSLAQDSFYGEEINSNGIVNFTEALTKVEGESVKIQGEIVQTCTKKGCWMTLAIEGQDELRVTFKDYSFFVPKEGVEGKKTIIQGKLVKSITDVETLRHFAQDAGKTKEEIEMIVDPKEEYSFVASGVIIKN